MFKEINGAVLPKRLSNIMPGCMKSFKELISPRTGTFLRSDSVTLSVWSLVLFLFVTFSLSEYFKKSHDIRNAIKFVVLLLGRRRKF